MGAEVIDTELPVSEVAPRQDSVQQCAGLADGVWQVWCYGGGFRATMAVACGGIDSAHVGFDNINSNGKD